MKPPKWIACLFLLTAVYDGGLGLLFLVAPGYPFDLLEVTPPNHFGYVQFPAALLIIFALMFLAVARNPVENRQLIPYGILLKLSYVGVTLRYWLTVDVPGMWKPLAVVDLIMVLLFLWAYVLLCRLRTAS